MLFNKVIFYQDPVYFSLAIKLHEDLISRIWY